MTKLPETLDDVLRNATDDGCGSRALSHIKVAYSLGRISGVEEMSARAQEAFARLRADHTKQESERA